MYAALPMSAERRTLAARARVRGEQKVRRGCEGSSIPYGAAFCRLRKGSDKLKAAVPDFCFPLPTFGNISHKYKRPPPEGPRRRFAPQSGLARPSSAGAAAFSALPYTQIPPITPPLAARCARRLTLCELLRRNSAAVSRQHSCRFLQARSHRTGSAPRRVRIPL